MKLIITTTISFVFLLFLTACWGLKSDCSNASLGRSIVIAGFRGNSQTTAQMYSAKRNTNFQNLKDRGSMRLNNEKESKNSSRFILFSNHYLMTPEYDYRLIVNDTLHFEFTNFVFERTEIADSTGKKTFCILKSYRVNGITCLPKDYNNLDAPIELAKVVK